MEVLKTQNNVKWSYNGKIITKTSKYLHSFAVSFDPLDDPIQYKWLYPLRFRNEEYSLSSSELSAWMSDLRNIYIIMEFLEADKRRRGDYEFCEFLECAVGR